MRILDYTKCGKLITTNCHGYQLQYQFLSVTHMLCVSCTCSDFVQFYCSGVRRDTSIPFVLCPLDPEGSQGLLATHLELTLQDTVQMGFPVQK